MGLRSIPTASMVAVLTVPSILWLFYRFGEILLRQHKALRHHIGQALSSITRQQQHQHSHGQGLVAFAAHVLTGLPLLAAAPYLAYLLVPDDQGGIEESSTIVMSFLGIALVVANAPAFLWILPHPSRHGAYKVDKRSFVRGLGILYVASLQFTAMGMSALLLLTENFALKSTLSLVVPAIYLWTVAICACECANPKFPWEHQFWASPILASIGYGMKSKSKVASAFVDGSDTRRNAMQYLLYSIFGVAGILAFVQSMAMLQSCIDPPTIPMPRAQEQFFVVFFLYVTIVMSSGFFTMIQTIFDSEKQPIQNDTKLLAEVMLTQAVPILLLQVGPAWIGANSFSEFFYRFILWKSG